MHLWQAKRPLTQGELEHIIDNLSNDDYCASDYGGDEDAEDNLPLDTSSSSRPSSGSSTPSCADDIDQPGTSSMDLRKKVLQIPTIHQSESDYEDGHDSDADPDFLSSDITAPANKIARLFPQRQFIF
ncbi:hypothetical protein NQ314_014145 [Rhamnusium bicolor]|uniref:Uncharacterized protein n=1 Tax=Rhamnusium bicolor TaxID=1586634 RepID=A0AAV8X2U0_9CUCU|nr:hypothetical protein NQ314_014145 [Rhamnusium bicolor]